MNVYNLSESQINAELIARGSRTHGNLQQKQDRLQRFLEFEDQKQRRARFVQQMRAEREETDGQQEREDTCSDTCECNRAQTAARTLLILRDDVERSAYSINQLIPLMQAVKDENQRLNQAFADLDESYEVMVGENLRLNNRINNLEMRLSHVENRSDSPPPMMFPESNPMWKLDEFHQY